MRFRATIENVPTFFRIIQAIEKLQKKCFIKFTEKEMHIICNDEANEGGIQVWSQIKVDSIFTSYRIQSNAANMITLSLPTSALLSVLKSASPSSSSNTTGEMETEEVVVKLAKKNDQAVLSFEIARTSRVGRKLRVGHDVRIEVLKLGDVERLREPLCPEPDVHILLPPLLKLRTIVDRLRQMSDVLSMRASNNGKLLLSINTDNVKVETQWLGLKNPPMREEEKSPSQVEEKAPVDPDHMFSVLVPLRGFLKFLNSHVVSSTTMACICQNHCMILYVFVGDVADAGGVLTFYIPAVVDDGF